MFSLMLARSRTLVPSDLVSCMRRKEDAMEMQEQMMSRMVTPVNDSVTYLT